MQNKKAALYIRVSTDAQREEGYSIEAQTEMLKAYCISRGIKDHILYVDGGFTGSNIQRPEMQRMIEDIKLGRISCVIVYKLDRLSRSQKDTLYLIEDILNPNGVGFVSLQENMDTSTPIGRAMLGIMSAFAQLERETIKERTDLGKRERVKSGLWPGGGKIPFGYDYDKERGILVPNKDAEIVRQIYSLYLQGYSTLKIARLTGLKYERLALQILKRKTNAGYIVYNGTEYKGAHEAIISEDVFNAVQEELKRRRRKGTKGAKCLLAGMIECGVCGAKMRYQKWSGGRYKIYCYSKDNSKTHLHTLYPCDNKSVWADELERVVLSDLFSLRYKISDDIRAENNDITDILKDRENGIRKRLSRLYKLYSQTDGREDEILLQQISALKHELEEISYQLEKEKENKSVSAFNAERMKQLGTLQGVWDTMTCEEKRTVLRELIDRIVITYDKTDIYYTSNII